MFYEAVLCVGLCHSWWVGRSMYVRKFMTGVPRLARRRFGCLGGSPLESPMYEGRVQRTSRRAI
jgi:hypothetical protein